MKASIWMNSVKYDLIIQFCVVEELVVLNRRLVAVVHLSPLSREGSYKKTEGDKTS